MPQQSSAALYVPRQRGVDFAPQQRSDRIPPRRHQRRARRQYAIFGEPALQTIRKARQVQKFKNRAQRRKLGARSVKRRHQLPERGVGGDYRNKRSVNSALRVRDAKFCAAYSANLGLENPCNILRFVVSGSRLCKHPLRLSNTHAAEGDFSKQLSGSSMRFSPLSLVQLALCTFGRDEAIRRIAPSLPQCRAQQLQSLECLTMQL